MASATDIGQESEQIKSVDAVCYPSGVGYDIRRFLKSRTPRQVYLLCHAGVSASHYLHHEKHMPTKPAP
jgi:hypothetical protein